ncbi:MAG: VWA domain-containing protein [Bryobacteraceae bacterium]
MRPLPALLLAVCTAAAAQEPPPLRVSAEEVLVDFVVRDRRGRQVTDLTIEEIEILEDGVPQKLRALRRVAGQESQEWVPGQQAASRRLDPSLAVKLTVLAFDELGASSRALALRAVEDLVRQGIPPNTYYAVVQLSPSFRIVQPFTNELYLIKWAAERLTGGRAARSEGVPPIARPTREAPSDDPVASAMAAAVAEMESRAAELERESASAVTLNGLLSMVLGLRRLEGRKTAILFSEGLPGGPGALRALIAQANRNNVAFYTIDARGLRAGGFLSGGETGAAAGAPETRAPGLEELAVETGGLAVSNTNDLRAPLRQVAEDSGGYYLASYSPQNTHWDGRFRKLQLRVKRPGVQVQGRSGYFALPPGMQALLFPHEVPLLRALSTNPLPRQIEFRAGMLRFGPARDGNVQCAFQIEIPIRALSVRRNEAAGTYDIHASFLVFVKDATGRAVRKATRDVPFSGPLEKLEAFQAGDFLYNDHFPLPPGRYVMESAVADRLGERVSAKRAAFVVPVPQPGRPLLSSIVLVRRVDTNPPEEIRYGEGDDRGPDPLRFRGGKVTPMLDNTVSDRAGFYFSVFAPGLPQPSAVVEILRDGVSVARWQAELVPEGEGRFSCFAVAPLQEAPPGDYEIRVIASAGSAVQQERAGFTLVR